MRRKTLQYTDRFLFVCFSVVHTHQQWAQFAAIITHGVFIYFWYYIMRNNIDGGDPPWIQESDIWIFLGLTLGLIPILVSILIGSMAYQEKFADNLQKIVAIFATVWASSYFIALGV